jgi:hypothetical protein
VAGESQTGKGSIALPLIRPSATFSRKGRRGYVAKENNMRHPVRYAVRIACLALLTALPLAGCISVEERRAMIDTQDDADCRSYGARPGTPAYIKCRTDVRQARAAESEARRPVIVASPVVVDPFWGPFGGPVIGGTIVRGPIIGGPIIGGPGPFGPRYCRDTPWGVRCY